MKMEITVAEALELINEIRKQPGSLFEMIRADVKQSVSRYMSELMDVELTDFLGRERYQRVEGKRNHRNGSYPRRYTLKGIGDVAVRVPRDRSRVFHCLPLGDLLLHIRLRHAVLLDHRRPLALPSKIPGPVDLTTREERQRDDGDH